MCLFDLKEGGGGSDFLRKGTQVADPMKVGLGGDWWLLENRGKAECRAYRGLRIYSIVFSIGNFVFLL